jgi:hypothetical protein
MHLHSFANSSINLTSNQMFAYLCAGIISHGGTIINKLTFEKLLMVDKAELKVAFRLTAAHLCVTGAERMRVRYALDILSYETAKALSYAFPSEQDAATLLERIAALFSVFSSRVSYDGREKLRCGFGLSLDEQVAALEEAEEVLLTMRVIGHSRLLPFQEGFLMSCASLRGMFSCAAEYGMAYCLTSRLNQDYIENFFSQIRGLGRYYDHPQAVEFKRRFRLLVIGANTLGCQKSVNVQQTEDNDYISANFLGGALDLAALPPACQYSHELSLNLNDLQSTSRTELEGLTSFASEGLKYIAGYVAFRLRSSQPQLGIKLVSSTSYSGVKPSWIEWLSRGGLMMPTDEWLQQAQQLEAEFQTFHGSSIRKSYGVTRGFSIQLSMKYPSIPLSAIQCFIRTRTFIRIKEQNRSLQAAKKQRLLSKKINKFRK